MEKPTVLEFHAAMYSKYPGISFESCLELYLELYPEDPKQTESKPKKKSKK